MVARRSGSAVLELSRQELYEKVWSVPGRKLAGDFGISDVALAKICRKFKIPKPTRGYWARLEAGQKPPKSPFPPEPTDSEKIRFDVATNQARRAKWAIPIPSGEAGSMPIEFHLPNEDVALSPLAQRILTLMAEAAPDETGRVKIEEDDTPKITASLGQASRLARAVQALTEHLVLQGVELSPGEAPRSTLRLTKEHDYFTLKIEEELEDNEEPPTPEEKRRPSWTWNRPKRLSGKFTFRLDSNQRLHGRTYWTECRSTPLEKILGTMAERMIGLFQKFEEERAAALVRQREWEAEEKRRKAAEAKRAHEKKIEDLADERAQNLAKAAEWWRLFRDMEHFIEACEERWRKKGKGKLRPEEKEWLTWARSQASRLSPFALNYPARSKKGNASVDPSKKHAY